MGQSAVELPNEGYQPEVLTRCENVTTQERYGGSNTSVDARSGLASDSCIYHKRQFFQHWIRPLLHFQFRRLHSTRSPRDQAGTVLRSENKRLTNDSGEYHSRIILRVNTVLIILKSSASLNYHQSLSGLSAAQTPTRPAKITFENVSRRVVQFQSH